MAEVNGTELMLSNSPSMIGRQCSYPFALSPPCWAHPLRTRIA
jgi:hypothetical protein